MTSNTRSDIIHRALRIAQRFKETVGPLCVNATPEKHTNAAIPPINLQLTAEINAELADTAAHQELRDTLLRQIAGSQADYQRIYDKACQRALASPSPQLHALDALATLMSNRFQKETIPSLLKEYLSTKEEIARSLQAASTIASTSSKPFNHVWLSSSIYLSLTFLQAFIPILTAYFMWNAFPPAADKRILASKGLMTDRQIDVWVSILFF